MKRLLECVVSIKSSACMVFTGTLLAFSLVCLCLGIGSITLAVIFEMALLSLLGATVQWVFFSGRVVKNMAYGKRIMLALPVFLVLFAGAALLFRWFPVANPTAWGLFLLIFILAFGGITLGFEIYFRVTGRHYDELLNARKKKGNTP